MYHKPLSLESYLSLSVECMSGPMGSPIALFLSLSESPSPSFSLFHTRKTIPHFPTVKVTPRRCVPVTKYFYPSTKPRTPPISLRGCWIINHLNMHEIICIIIQGQQYGSHLFWHLERVVWSRWWREGEEKTWFFVCKDFSSSLSQTAWTSCFLWQK